MFINIYINIKYDRNESFQKYEMRILIYQIILDIIMKIIIKLIKENLIISSNINLQIMKLEDIN